jgi:hypothetical protein
MKESSQSRPQELQDTAESWQSAFDSTLFFRGLGFLPAKTRWDGSPSEL